MKTNEKSAGINDIESNLHDVEDELQDFEERQVNVTRTLQMIVYPAMVAFIILSAYGFYLVQSLTTDVHHLTSTIANMHNSVDTNMTKMTGSIESMNSQMGSLVNSTGQMTNNIVGMNSSTQDMAGNIQQMNASTQNMAVSTYNMQRDMWSMNKNISGPMKMFNKFSPFGNDTTSPYVVPPPAVATPYYNYYTTPAGTVAQGVAVQPQAVQPPAPTAATIEVQPATNAVQPVVEIPVTQPPSNDSTTAKDGHSSLITEDEKFASLEVKG
ncbi:hypothetical protein HMY34_12055 [Thiothrix subterranea]|uniref:hypothetical protein n=1 Tax=Thiothrix subterranea TaxID=2735563 RepID=UPI00192CC07B|nr:hypothetical protein [Thiothrix subterranea]QQZ29446.1 hypothetical protein HMY34_12055 [Thiothrix subterranea]